MTWRLSSAGALLLVGAIGFCLGIAYVWRRRSSSAGSGLLLVLLAAALWSVFYALELSGADLATRQLWGDLKYLGLVLLPPAFLIFVLQYTGQSKYLRWWVMLLVAVEPLVVLVLLAVDGTHDLIRFYPPGSTVETMPVAANGSLFWPNAVYSYGLIWLAMGLYIARLGRMSGIYRRQSIVLFLALLIPFAANVLYDLDVGVFGRVELTPFLLTLSCAALIWGLFRFRLLDLLPVARSRIFQTIGDAVMVLDRLGRVLDVNPAAERLLGTPLAGSVGQAFDHLLPGWAPQLAEPSEEVRSTEAERGGRTYELTITPLNDRRGRLSGHLLVAHDITDRKWAEEDMRMTLERLRGVDEQRQHLLSRLVDAREDERKRIAGSLYSESVQSVSTVLVRLRVAGLSMEPGERQRWLEDVTLPLTNGLDHLRGLLAELRQPIFDRSGLAAALDEYAQPIRDTGAVVEVKSQVGKDLPEETRMSAFRIALEALSNVREHSLASMVIISVEESGDGVLVRIEDNGVGFAHRDLPNLPPPTLGISTMRERAKAAGGWLRVESAPGEGTTVEYWLPA
jgi:PAS domain S-box-containing protein